MGHTEEPCEIHLKDVARNKVGDTLAFLCKIKSVKPMRYQGAAVRKALIEVRDNTKDPAITSEAQSLFEEAYRFSLCTVVWYEMLSAIQHVSKLM